MTHPNTPKEVLEGFSERVTLRPGLSTEEINHFQKKLRRPLPDDVQELLKYSAGFDFKLNLKRTPVGSVRFAGDELGSPGEVLSVPIALLGDGYGNYWVADVDPINGNWGTIFLMDHDPPVIAIQAPDLPTFLTQILDPEEGSPKDALNHVRKEAVTRIWKGDPSIIPAIDARRSKDPMVSNFANELPDNFGLADLRSREVGSGFSWGKAGPNADVRRYGTELLFGVEQKAPNFLQRVLRRRR